jgi:RNase P subunit RPR2
MAYQCMYSADRHGRGNRLPIPHVVPRVLCPRCGTSMRLAQARVGSHGDETLIFDCVCPFEYRMSPRARDEAHAIGRGSL